MSNDMQLQVVEQDDQVQKQESKGNGMQRVGAQKFMRYGVIIVLAFALIIMTGWLLQVRSEAQTEAQTGVEVPAGVVSTYVRSSGATEQEPVSEEIAMAPVAPVQNPVTSEKAANVAMLSLMPTPTPIVASMANDSVPEATMIEETMIEETMSVQKVVSTIVRGQGATLYTMPGGEIVESLPSGTVLRASGRASEGGWIYVTTTNGARGWVEAGTVVLFNVEQLRVMETDLAGAPVVQTVVEADAVTPVTSDAAPSVTDAGQRPRPVLQDGQIAAQVALTGSRLNVRSGPGTNYPVVAKAYPDEAFLALGRDNAGIWIEIQLPESPDQVAWVSADFVTLTAPIEGLSVSDRTGSPLVAQVAAPASATNVSTNGSTVAGASASALSGKLAIQGSDGVIYVHNLDTGATQSLTAGYDPAISPDGRTVAFVREGGQHGIYLIGMDGANERRIFNGGEVLRAPTWSPDGQWIAFSHKTGSYGCREVGLGICYADNGPFLDSFPEGSQSLYGIARIDFNGENFSDLPSVNSAQAPEWGVAGIVYGADRTIEITQNVLGDQLSQQVVSKPFYQDPTWRPDGGRIAFHSREGTHWEIFAVNPDGSGLVALTRPVTALVDELPHNVAPTWSPDGQQIIFLSSRDNDNEHSAWRFWIMNGDGSEQRPLSIDVPLQYSYANEQMVSWSL